MVKRGRTSSPAGPSSSSSWSSRDGPSGGGERPPRASHRARRLHFKNSPTSSSEQSKRPRNEPLDPIPCSSSTSALLPTSSLEGSLAQEILLRCLFFLDADDLVNVARVSSAWHRLTNDNQLWRALYLRTFASSSSASSLSDPNRSRPWRELYKISSNWRRGHARTTTLGRSVRRSVLPELPPTLTDGDEASTIPVARPVISAPTQGPPRPHIVRPFDFISPPPSTSPSSPLSPRILPSTSDTLIQFHRHYYFLASRLPPSDSSSPVPSVQVHQMTPNGGALLLGEIVSPAILTSFSVDGRRPRLAITSIELDKSTISDSTIRLAIFLSTGQLSLISVTLPTSTKAFAWREIYASLTTTSPGAFGGRHTQLFDPVAIARFHLPLLVTCSQSFVVRFFRITAKDGDEGPQCLVELHEASRRLQTMESWAPISLTLESWWRSDGAERSHVQTKRKGMQEFKVTLAFSTPVFPDSWSIGVQEFDVGFSSSSSTIHPGIDIASRHAVARHPSPPTHGPSISSSNRGTLVTGIEHSGEYVVTSRADNTLDVYMIISQPRRLDTPGGNLRVEHVRTLFGHTARVSSVALALEPDRHRAAEDGGSRAIEGKVVSASEDGTVKVWPLYSDPIAEGRAMSRRRGTAPIDVVDPDARARRRGSSVWEELKRSRGIKEKNVILKLGIDQEKIVSIVRHGVEGGEERVEVMRFD